MRKYCFNNLKSSRVEEVFHYLTPNNTVLRGKKHVYNYMLDTETFNQDDFNKFHFSKREPPVRKARQSSGDQERVKRRRVASGWVVGVVVVGGGLSLSHTKHRRPHREETPP